MTDEIDDMELRLRVTLSELVLFVLYIIVLGIGKGVNKAQSRFHTKFLGLF